MMYASKVLQQCVILIASVLSRLYCLETDCIIIGIIGDAIPFTNQPTQVSIYGYNVTYRWIAVDTEEIFHVYNAVQRFDGDASVDVIILANVSQASQRLSQFLQTQHKPLIRWGAQEINHSTMDGEVCEGDDTNTTTNDREPVYCTRMEEDQMESNFTIDESYTKIVPDSITKLVVRLEWNRLIVIHDTRSEHDASEIIKSLSINQMIMIVINIDHVNNLEDMILKVYMEESKHAESLRFIVACRYTCARKVLRVDMILKVYMEESKHAESLRFIVACRYTCARKVLRVANSFDDNMSAKRERTLLKQFSMWLLVLYGHERTMSYGLRTCAHDLDNVVIVAIPEWKGSNIQTISIVIAKSIYKATQTDINFNVTAPMTKDMAIRNIEQTAASLHPSVRCKGFNIDTLLWAGTKGRSFTNIGYIDQSGTIFMESDLFPNRKYGYNKRTFIVSTLEYKPFVMSNISANGTKTYYGFCIDLLKELGDILNFTTVFQEPADKKWGSYLDREKEIFNGIIGQLQRREVDISVAPLAITADRERQMDFTYPFYYEVTTVLMRRIDPMTRKWRTLVDPFRWEVHVAIGIALIVVTAFLWLLEKCNWFYNNRANAEIRRQNGGLHNLHNSFWYMYGALLCQGGIHLPDSVSGRTFVSCWWLFCIIVVGTYCGNLIAFLTVTKDKQPFTNLQELVDRKGEYKWGTVGATNWENTFVNTARVPLYMDVGRGMVEFNKSDPTVLGNDPAAHVQKVLKESYAWIADKTYMEFNMARECDLVTSNDEFLPMSYAFGFQNNSPHSVIFANQLLKIHESGLLRIWKRKWWPKATFCKKDRIVTDSQPITLADVQSAFYVCVVGIGLGLLAFIGEVAIFKYKTYRRTGKRKNEQTEETEVPTCEEPIEIT